MLPATFTSFISRMIVSSRIVSLNSENEFRHDSTLRPTQYDTLSSCVPGPVETFVSQMAPRSGIYIVSDFERTRAQHHQTSWQSYAQGSRASNEMLTKCCTGPCTHFDSTLLPNLSISQFVSMHSIFKSSSVVARRLQ